MSIQIQSKLIKDFKFSSPVFRYALKAAIAITIAIAAAASLDLAHSAWIPISVIVVMRPSLGGTLSISWKRFSGTVAGACAGVLLILLNPSMISVFIIVSLLLFSMLYFKPRNYTVFTCCLTISVVLVLGTLFSQTWQGSIERVFDTFIGISIGLAASFLIWPDFARKSLRKEMGNLINSQHTTFKQLRKAYFSNNTTTHLLLEGRLKSLTQLESCTEKVKNARSEPGLKSSQRQGLINLIELFTRMHRTLTATSSIVRKSTGISHGSFQPEFEAFMNAVEEEFILLEIYTRTGKQITKEMDFNITFKTLMAFLDKMQYRKDSENLNLDMLNNAAAFLWQINALGMELRKIKEGIKALRKTS